MISGGGKEALTMQIDICTKVVGKVVVAYNNQYF